MVFPSFSVYIIVFRQSPAVSVSTLFSFFLWDDLQCSLDFLSICVLFLCIADYIYLSPYFSDLMVLFFCVTVVNVSCQTVCRCNEFCVQV